MLWFINIFINNHHHTIWLPDSEIPENLEDQSAAEEAESANTENTQEVEVTQVASPTIEPPWTDTIPDTLAKKVSDTSLSKETDFTSPPSILKDSGLSSRNNPELSMPLMLIECLWLMSPKLGSSKFWEKVSCQLNQLS